MRFSEHVMIIDNVRENSGASSNGMMRPRVKPDMIRIIQDRRSGSTKPLATVHHNNYHHHHHHRRLSNSTSSSEMAAAAVAASSHAQRNHSAKRAYYQPIQPQQQPQQHQHLDPKLWNGISAFFSSNLDKRSIKS